MDPVPSGTTGGAETVPSDLIGAIALDPRLAIAAAVVIAVTQVLKALESRAMQKLLGAPMSAITKMLGPMITILVAWAITQDPGRALLVAGIAVLGFDQHAGLRKWVPLIKMTVSAYLQAQKGKS